MFTAINRALVILSWQENLPKEEVPPRRIWLDGEKLKEHFAQVEKNRERENDPKKGKIEDPVDNAAAEGLIVGG